ncbi:hypothetical protein [Marmoricola sp. RAF53]|uniref:hypothetical protein n=1 Tax=Marmoricola sp. RAF53 TaxID=3233059 RepID=UPI003F95A597
MLWMLIAMVLILAAAAVVVVYVAYPHRGEEVPGAPWVGEALKRGVEAMPVLEGEFDEPRVPEQGVRRLFHPDETGLPADSPAVVETPDHVQDGPTLA